MQSAVYINIYGSWQAALSQKSSCCHATRRTASTAEGIQVSASMWAPDWGRLRSPLHAARGGGPYHERAVGLVRGLRLVVGGPRRPGRLLGGRCSAGRRACCCAARARERAAIRAGLESGPGFPEGPCHSLRWAGRGTVLLPQ